MLENGQLCDTALLIIIVWMKKLTENCYLKSRK